MIVIDKRVEVDVQSGRREHLEWRTSFPQGSSGQLAGAFGAIESFKEERVPPRAVMEQSTQGEETITYLREGTLEYQDSTGRAGLIHAGEFQRTTAGRGFRYSEINPSPTQSAQVFRVILRCVSSLAPGHEWRRFTVAERRGVLCVVASPDARRGSLKVSEDTVLYSVILRRGQHVLHELAGHRRVWLHVVQGSVRLAEFTLNAGDGAGIADERAVSVTAHRESEVLLVDVCLPTRRPSPSPLDPAAPPPPFSAGDDAPRSRARRVHH